MVKSHYKERLFDRFLDKTTLTVGFEIKGTVGKYEKVGTYSIPKEIKDTIIENTKMVETTKFNPAKSYGVKIASFNINKADVAFISDEHRFNSAGKELLFLDSETESNGNLVYLIVRDSKIKTIFFAKNYVPQNEAKMRVDNIIQNINSYKNN